MQEQLGNVGKQRDGAERLNDLFEPEHYKYRTVENGRTPTYYYDNGRVNGRLRTKHKDGPVTEINATRMTPYFVDEAVFGWLKENYHKHTADDYRQYRTKNSNVGVVKNGMRHFEVKLKGNKILAAHFSGGLVSTDSLSLEDEAIIIKHQARVSAKLYE